MAIDLLCNELILIICLYLDVRSLVRLSHTNKKLYDLISKDKIFWRKRWEYIDSTDFAWLSSLAANPRLDFIVKNEWQRVCMLYTKTKSNWLFNIYLVTGKNYAPGHIANRVRKVKNFRSDIIVLSVYVVNRIHQFVIYDLTKSGRLQTMSVDFYQLTITDHSFDLIIWGVYNFRGDLMVVDLAEGKSRYTLCLKVDFETLTSTLSWGEQIKAPGIFLLFLEV